MVPQEIKSKILSNRRSVSGQDHIIFKDILQLMYITPTLVKLINNMLLRQNRKHYTKSRTQLLWQTIQTNCLDFDVQQNWWECYLKTVYLLTLSSNMNSATRINMAYEQKQHHSCCRWLHACTIWRGLYTTPIYIDCFFDTVNHGMLLTKLNNIGFKGVCNKWLESYLRAHCFEWLP